MRATLLTLTVLAACATLISSCATSGQPSAPVIPPRREMPATAIQPCVLVGRLPASPTMADLEIGYAVRGAEILSCDARRQLAVDVHGGEHRVLDDLFQAGKSSAHWVRLSGATSMAQSSISTALVTATHGRSRSECGVLSFATMAATRPVLR